jgi:membrane-associated protease RseP (regulator of RpoE activity)
MDSRYANRKQMFDIGIAGPLAGLVVAIPLLILGLRMIDFSQPPLGPYQLTLPLGLRWLAEWLQLAGFKNQTVIGVAQLNPYFMAGWVGLLVTALNLLPIGQLDGGHITYTLFGRWAHWIARGIMLMAILYMVYTNSPAFLLMAIMLFFTGIDHPPTKDDRVPMGWFRYALGMCTLLIPIFFLSPEPILQRF